MTDTSQDVSKKAPSISRAMLQAYRSMLTSLFIATALLTALIAALLLVFDHDFFFNPGPGVKEPSILLFVTLEGALGSFVSALIRLYNFTELPKALLDGQLQRFQFVHLVMYSLVPPIVGAIGAAALYLMFAAGLLEGVLFPKFGCNPGAECSGFGGLIEHWAPVSAQDYAKALVWGFIAGFSERVVPDALQRLAKSASKPGADRTDIDASPRGLRDVSGARSREEERGVDRRGVQVD